ncbi:MAG: hypothetical protein H6584_08580 [Flavobacteriales bacterium]|nr:hypothetical protein [Flavobacteriales bacterium]
MKSYYDFLNTLTDFFPATEVSFIDKLKQVSKESWKKINFNQSEPKVIEQYFNKGIEYMNLNFASQYTESQKRFEMKFASLFCHQKPKVARSEENKKSLKVPYSKGICELGDLMVCFVLLNNNKEVVFSNAHIFQAKWLSEKQVKNLTQKFLYEFDDSFKWGDGMNDHKLSYVTSEERILPTYNEKRTQALSYLKLDDTDKANKNVFIEQIPLNTERTFNWDELYLKLMFNDFGLPFKYDACSEKNNWDTIITELINALYNSHISSDPKRPRGNNFTELLTSFNYYYYYYYYYYVLLGNVMPTMFVIVKDTKN